MKIGIIGSGIVGRVLGSAFLKEGHSVTLGTRNTSKPEVIKWKTENPSGTIEHLPRQHPRISWYWQRQVQ